MSLGRQALGALLFFVPRSIWPGKPIGSGATTAIEANYALTNVSMNILGEGYINFGIVGVFLVVALFGFVCGKIERAYWRQTYNPGVLSAYYLFFIGAVVFIFRGDLLSSFAYSVGSLISVYLVVKIACSRELTSFDQVQRR